MSNSHLEMIRKYAEMSATIPDDLAMAVLHWPDDGLDDIFSITTQLRCERSSQTVSLCGILNIKSGSCSEDCCFCAQSEHHPDSPRQRYGLLSGEQILQAYDTVAAGPMSRFSLVSCGLRLPAAEVSSLCDSIVQRTDRPRWCASLGCLREEELYLLKMAGVSRYHHNIESAESFYNTNVCSTHSFQDRLDTIRAARAVGMEVCCGGIIGLGESFEQRVEFARTLKNEKVDSIALNFLIPVKGTPLESAESPDAATILRTIAMVRLVNPEAELRVAAGRALLGDQQARIFDAGANGMMTGDFLTTTGSDLDGDLKMLREAKLAPSLNDGEVSL